MMFISASILEGFVPSVSTWGFNLMLLGFDAAVIIELDFVLLFVVVALSRSLLTELQL